MRIYDQRIAKFLSVDPIKSKYPELSVYQFASNSPILGIDKDGEEIENAMSKEIVKKSGVSKLPIKNIKDGMGDAELQIYTLKVMGDLQAFTKLKETYSQHPEIIHNKNNPLAQYKPLNTVTHQNGNVSYTDPKLEKGDHMFIEILGPGNDSYVRFIDVELSGNSFKITAATLYGHVDAGIISFSGTYNPDTKEISFTIANITRNNYGLGEYRNSGRLAQHAQWNLILDNVQDYIGGDLKAKKSQITTYSWDENKNALGEKKSTTTTDIMNKKTEVTPEKTPSEVLNTIQPSSIGEGF